MSKYALLARKSPNDTRMAGLDQELFYWVNSIAAHPWLDAFLPVMRDSKFWIPFYVALIGIMIYTYRWNGLKWVFACAASVGIADVMSSHVIKPWIQRPRPCHVESGLEDIILRVSCGTGYSFTSSHATNHTAMAMFIIVSTMVLGWGSWRWIFLLWAMIISYAQVYVGVHYPFDVACGTLLGSLIGTVGALVYKRWIHRDALLA